jgi:hypothetical protein
MSIEFAKKILKLAVELEQSASYWSEYDVPLGIHDRILEAKNDCLVEIKAEILSLNKQADFLAFQAGLLQQWLNEVLSDE